MFTFSMALGSRDLARFGVLVTRLSAVEDAATMDVLCVDKTGTITLNHLTVTDVLPQEHATSADVLCAAALASQEANQDPIDLALLAEAKARHAFDVCWHLHRYPSPPSMPARGVPSRWWNKVTSDCG